MGTLKHKFRAVVAAAMPGTITELIERTRLNISTIKRWLRDLRDSGESHICGWRRPKTTGPFVAVHAYGPGKDKPCRLKMESRAKSWAKYRAKQRAAEIDMVRARVRARYWEHKASKRTNTWAGALFALAMPRTRIEGVKA